MLRTRIFWAVLLGVVSMVLIVEAKTNLTYGAMGGRILGALSAPGSHVAVALNNSSSFAGERWAKLWAGLALACNFLTYLFFWYICIWLIGYLRGRRHPYDREGTLVR